MSFAKAISWVCLFAWLVILGPLAHAVDYQWVGGSSTNPTGWHTATNWTPTGVPGVADHATIGENATVTISGDVNVAKLFMEANSTIQGAGNLTVSHIFKAKDATLDGAGLLTFPSGCTVDFDSVLPTSAVNRNTKARKRIKNRGICHLNGGNLVLGADFENDLGGTFEIKTDGAVTWSGVERPRFKNRGKLVKSAGSAISTITAPLENTGTIAAEFGTLDLGPAFTQTAGTTALNGGNIASNSPISIQGGTLEGTGQIKGNLVNSGGHIKPGHSPGAITILGNFTQTSNGTLNMELAGLNPGLQYDQIVVQGNASLAGNLNLTWLGGFLPNPGDSFTLLEYWSSDGSFGNVSGCYPGNKRFLTTSYTPAYFLASTNVDTTAPTVAITSPAASALLTGQFSVTGNANDGGSGLDAVSLRLYRFASSTATAGYWNGSSWDATYDAVQHEKRANGTAVWNLLLPKLATGRYKLRATAKDKVANAAVSPEVTISVDNGVPANVAITTPAAGSFLNKLPVISVVATDDSGGSGIGRVDLSLKQMSTSKYWTGSAWGAETALATTFSTKGWQSAFSLPTGLNLPNGTYQIIAKATDKVGLSQSISNTVTVDITAPTVTIANPASLGVSKNLPSATGSAADGSSQVKSIKIRLYRYASSTATAGYWNGSSWDAAYNSLTHQLPATGTTTWNRALLVNSASRVDGKYYIQATATDGAGNAGSITHAFWLDSVAPQSVTIDTPPTGAKVKTLSTIAGRCVDNTGGQGIARTELRIRRDRDLVYWTGSGWTATLTALQTELSGTSWRRSHSSTMPLPTGVDLSDGAYTFVAIAYDKAGNSRSASATIAVDQTLPTVGIINPRPDASYKQLSSITGTSRDLGTGISKVTVRLYRYASSTAAAGYWAGGDNWTSTYSAANELAVSGTTSWSLALPLLNEGKYYCLATATDKAGNTVKTPVTPFAIDRTLPTVAITRPATNPAFLRTLTSLAGTASDSQGLAKVSVRIYRYATATTPAGYWAGGENWTTTYSAANEYLATGTTSWSLALPTLSDGRYFSLATATDKAGNSTSTVASVFTVDSIAPSVAITRPATNPAFSTSLPAVTGTAADVGGLAKVTVRVFRAATSTTAAGYWAGGENWTSTYSVATNQILATGLSSWSLTLPPLAEGKYFCMATATDKAANTAVTAAHVFTIDRTLPTVAIAQPAVDNQILQTLPAITGTAYDQVGIGKVTVRLYRYATATTAAGYWAGGENWTSTYSVATNQILATGTTSWSLTLPPLAEGKYYCLATATDLAGNSTNTPARAFTIDTTGPEVLSITSPVAGAFVKSLSAIAGTAGDTVAGLDRVELYLQRADGRFWTGVKWSDAKVLPASYDSVKRVWSSTGDLPAGDLLSDGEYTITAQAFDKVGNQKSVTSHFTVDTTAPVVSVSNPQNNGAYAALSEASGIASDSRSGVARVTVALFRDATLTTPTGYWNGASWNETYDSSLHELTATGTTDWSFTLPHLETGSYTLRATAIDVVGNSGTSDEVNFTLIAPPVENQTAAESAETSPVVLSSTEAVVASSQVQLLFTDGLNADSANNLLNYRVSVNNQEVPLNSARYDAATNRVVLQLPTDALRSGDQVVAFWQALLDEQGRAVTGQTEVLVAR